MVKYKIGRRSGANQGAGQTIWQRSAVRDLFARAMMALVLLGLIAMFLPASGRIAYLVVGVLPLIIATAVRVLQINYPGKFTFSELRENAFAWYESLERHQRFYINVVVFMIFLGYTYILGERDIFPAIVPLFVLYCFGVAVYDIIRIYRVLSNTMLGKGLIAIGFAVGSNLAFCFAGAIIGEITLVAPSTFPHTLSFLAIAAIPFLSIFIGVIYLPIAMLTVPFVWMASEFERVAPILKRLVFARKFERPARRYVIATLMFQVFLYSFLGIIVPRFLISTFDQYSHQIESSIGDIIYAFDMYPGTECKVGAGYRVSALGDENYVLATKSSLGVKFEKPRKCSLSGN
jgi:hypothetical protein